MKQAENGIRRWVWQGGVTFPSAGGQGHGAPEEVAGVVCSKDSGTGEGAREVKEETGVRGMCQNNAWQQKEMEPQILRLELKHKGSPSTPMDSFKSPAPE